MNREARHNPKEQRQRRSNIAQLRNFLFTTTSSDEYGVVWIDADIYRLENGLLKRMIESGNTKPIITASCRSKWSDDYDL